MELEDSLEEDFQKLVNTTRVRVLNRDDKDVNGAVSEWLALVDQVIEEMKKNADEEKKTDEWCPKLIKKIHVLDEMEKSNFTEDAHLLKLVHTTNYPLFKRQYIEPESSPATSSSRSKPFKSGKEVLDQKDDFSNNSPSHSPDENSPSAHASTEFASSNNIEEAQKDDDTFQGLQQQDDRYHSFGLFGKRGSDKTAPMETLESTLLLFDISSDHISQDELEREAGRLSTPSKSNGQKTSTQKPNKGVKAPSIEDSGVKSPPSHAQPKPIIPSPYEESTSSSMSKPFKSTNEILDQKLRPQKDDTSGNSRKHSLDEKSTSTHLESISSTKFASSYSMEETQKHDDDSFQGLQQSSSGDFMYLGSPNQAKNYLLEALLDNRYHSIGLFGKRGSGKTALVNAEMSKYKNIFHLVLFVTVSEKVDIAKLQNQIAPQLNLKFQAVKSKYKRASAIESSLLKGKDNKVLAIFDDVSTNFGPHDIEDIGIPNPDPNNKCKILLITHDKKYCNMIKCHPWIPLHPLSDEDAWKLLQQCSGIDHDSPSDLFDVAREVAFRCKGLPRVIEDVVSSLQNYKTEHWKETLNCLRHSTACHQIFISFRGRDTRDNFTASLYDALIEGGFKVFKDDKLRIGDYISEALIKAIEQSRCSIVVLSENFAESSWCLDELVKILKCRKEMNQLVLPIFYKVDPSHVRYVKESFGEAMAKKKERFKEDKIQEWISVLYEVSSLSGRGYTRGSQIHFIKEIVQYVRDNYKHRLHICI